MIEDIEAHRRVLADVLDGLTAEQWHGSSMCAGWSPAHVLAHLTMPFRIPPEEFMTGLQRAGDFTRYSDEVASRDSQIAQERLVAVLRANAANPWSPPGGGLLGALSHDVIHGLDVTWPLPVTYQIPDRAMTAVLDSVAADGRETLFGVSLAGLRASATDLDWSAGDGAPLTGRSRDLLMLLTGRAVPRVLFGGDGADLVGAVVAR